MLIQIAENPTQTIHDAPNCNQSKALLKVQLSTKSSPYKTNFIAKANTYRLNGICMLCNEQPSMLQNHLKNHRKDVKKQNSFHANNAFDKPVKTKCYQHDPI